MTRVNGGGQSTVSRGELRPFFCYYGGKWRDAMRYPTPKHSTIVEPFAGAAGYALRYPNRRVVLCEIDPIVASVWSYLVRVRADEVLALPDLEGHVDDLAIPQEARWLIGFWLNKGCSSPRKTPSSWMRSGIRPGSFWGERVRQTIASQLEAIRHWRVLHGSFEHCPEMTATWFVDPPYEGAGSHYRYGSRHIDYAALGAWCRGRSGQVIVCENEGASWLPFEPLASAKTTRAGQRSREAVWTRRPEDNSAHGARRRCA